LNFSIAILAASRKGYTIDKYGVWVNHLGVPLKLSVDTFGNSFLNMQYINCGQKFYRNINVQDFAEYFYRFNIGFKESGQSIPEFLWTRMEYLKRYYQSKNEYIDRLEAKLSLRLEWY
jgi:hypothetical protein